MFGKSGIGKKRGPKQGMYYPSRFSAQHKLGSKLRMKLPKMNPGLGKIKL